MQSQIWWELIDPFVDSAGSRSTGFVRQPVEGTLRCGASRKLPEILRSGNLRRDRTPLRVHKSSMRALSLFSWLEIHAFETAVLMYLPRWEEHTSEPHTT